jgi:hypothetical protein
MATGPRNSQMTTAAAMTTIRIENRNLRTLEIPLI